MARKVIAILLTTILSGCSVLQKAVQSPKAELKKIEVEKITTESIQLLAHLEATNPNPFALTLSQVDYLLKIGDEVVSQGQSLKGLELASKTPTPVMLQVQLPFKAAFKSITAFLQNPQTSYILTGKARIGPLTIPFEKKGDLNIEPSALGLGNF